MNRRDLFKLCLSAIATGRLLPSAEPVRHIFMRPHTRVVFGYKRALRLAADSRWHTRLVSRTEQKNGIIRFEFRCVPNRNYTAEERVALFGPVFK